MADPSASACLCSQCSALCCRYFALPIDNPTCAGDYDNIRWYLVHENVTIFVEKKQWYIGIANRCKHLQADNRCGIYETRPKICRQYSTENCDYHGGEYDFEMLFTSAEQLEKYAKDTLLEERAKRRRRRQAKEKQAKPNLMGLADKLKRRLAAGAVNGNGAAKGKLNGRTLSLPLLGGGAESPARRR
jgi:Fe-S-cluster containining protein